MPRPRIAIVGATLLLVAAVGPASAADGCPPAASGFDPAPVNWDWQPGDPIPQNDELWEVTVLAGLAAEGLTINDALELFGFTTAAEFYAFALEGWRGLDRNVDGTVCYKALPENQQGLPAYFSNFIDNNARTGR